MPKLTWEEIESDGQLGAHLMSRARIANGWLVRHCSKFAGQSGDNNAFEMIFVPDKDNDWA